MWLLWALLYVSGYIASAFLALSVASGLYFLADLAEEHSVLTKRILTYMVVVLMALHLLLWVVGDIPFLAMLVGLAAHGCYLAMMDRFPDLELLSWKSISGLILFLLSHWFWLDFLRSQNFYTLHMALFFQTFVWIAPLGLLVSVTINESSLPFEQGHSESIQLKNPLMLD
jgi:hypothetical protein